VASSSPDCIVSDMVARDLTLFLAALLEAVPRGSVICFFLGSTIIPGVSAWARGELQLTGCGASIAERCSGDDRHRIGHRASAKILKRLATMSNYQRVVAQAKVLKRWVAWRCFRTLVPPSAHSFPIHGGALDAATQFYAQHPGDCLGNPRMCCRGSCDIACTNMRDSASEDRSTTGCWR